MIENEEYEQEIPNGEEVETEVSEDDNPVTEIVSEPVQPDFEPVVSAAEPVEPLAPPVEVISVDELLERLTVAEPEPEEEPEEPVEEIAQVEEEEPILNTIDLTEVKTLLMDIRNNSLESSPALETPFEEYSVSEALMLSLLVCFFISALARIVRRGFSWLS